MVAGILGGSGNHVVQIIIDPAPVAREAAFLVSRGGGVTYGSSSCPALPIQLDVSANNHLKATVNPLPSGPCTADLAATTSVIEIPNALDITRDVTVTITGDGHGATVSLSPRPSRRALTTSAQRTS